MVRSIWERFRALPKAIQLSATLVLLGGIAYAARSSTPSDPQNANLPIVAANSPSPSSSHPPGPSATPSLTTHGPIGVPVSAQEGVVERIVDGDTIWVRIDKVGGPLIAGATHKIRLLEIDTPESGKCWATQATKFLTQRIPVGSAVYLLADKEDRDRFDRFLRYVWDSSGGFVNLQAARQGHAKAVLYMPNDLYINDMRAAADAARAEGLGLWGACGNAAAAAPPPTPGGDCHPSYEGVCVPKGVEDVDCEGGGGNGPYYVRGPIKVVGPDEYKLDGNGDGIACNS